MQRTRTGRPIKAGSADLISPTYRAPHLHRILPRLKPPQSESFLCAPVTTFRMNSCRKVSNRTTLSPFRMNSYVKPRGGGWGFYAFYMSQPVTPVLPTPKCIAPLFSFAYKPLFPQPLCIHIHTKPPGVWGTTPIFKRVGCGKKCFGVGRSADSEDGRYVSCPDSPGRPRTRWNATESRASTA